MNSPRPPATVSIDLDDLWAYLRVHGDAGWEESPSFLGRAVPRMLDLLHARGMSVTVFVVGRDAALPKNGPMLRQIRDAGHEIGNHSFHHQPSFVLGNEDEIDRELSAAEEAIERATGIRPRGFRGPGFSLSANLLRVLAKRAYAYDASTFPSIIGPLARAYYQATVKSSAGGAEQRENLYGGWRDGLRPLNPYRWHSPEEGVIEIPVTTFPFLRVPIHLTYISHLYQRAPHVALAYFRAATRACRMSGTVPSILMHPLDVLGKDEVPKLAFFPGMNLTDLKKVELVGRVLDVLRADFAPTTMGQYARTLDQAAKPLPSQSF